MSYGVSVSAGVRRCVTNRCEFTCHSKRPEKAATRSRTEGGMLRRVTWREIHSYSIPYHTHSFGSHPVTFIRFTFLMGFLNSFSSQATLGSWNYRAQAKMKVLKRWQTFTMYSRRRILSSTTVAPHAKSIKLGKWIFVEAAFKGFSSFKKPMRNAHLSNWTVESPWISIANVKG